MKDNESRRTVDEYTSEDQQLHELLTRRLEIQYESND